MIGSRLAVPADTRSRVQIAKTGPSKAHAEAGLYLFAFQKPSDPQV